MAIVRIPSPYRDVSTIVTHPSRSFMSSSKALESDVFDYPYEGYTNTGSLSIVARPSKILKDFPDIPLGGTHDGATYESGDFTPFVTDDDFGPYYFADAIKANPAYSVDGVITEGADIGAPVGIYTASVHARPERPKNKVKFNIRRFRPPYKIDQVGKGITSNLSASDLGKKRYIINSLMPKYRHRYTNCQLAYTNYNTLNFFTGTSVSGNTALIYPNFTGTLDRSQPGAATPKTNIEVFQSSPFVDINPNGHAGRGRYTPSGSFTFSFYINPRYTIKKDEKEEFHAGTIMHLSSTFAVSLVSGSEYDSNGKLNSYRIMLQLTQSANVPPHLVKIDPNSPTGSSRTGVNKEPYNRIFLSQDSSLKHNSWHHVAIRWGTNTVNDGSGSFIIDGVDKGTFNVPSSTIAPNLLTNATPVAGPTERVGGTGGSEGPHRTFVDPDAMIIGNFYEGANYGNGTGQAPCQLRFFFNDYASLIEGIEPSFPKQDGEMSLSPTVQPAISPTNTPSGGSAVFRHPLNAEVHDIRIYDTFRDRSDILTSSMSGPVDYTDMLFYLPVMFVKSSGKYPRVFTGNCGRTLYQRWAGSLTSIFGAFFGAEINDFISPIAGFDTGRLSTVGNIYSGTYLERPFNAGLSKNVDATIINLENFCMDFANKVYPRLHGLTASITRLTERERYNPAGMRIGKINFPSNILEPQTTDTSEDTLLTNDPFCYNGKYWDEVHTNNGSGQYFVTGSPRSALDYFYATASLRKRNLTILPNDNGLFRPNFDLLLSGADMQFPSSSSPMSLFIDANGARDLSVINVENVFDRWHYTSSVRPLPPIASAVITSMGLTGGPSFLMLATGAAGNGSIGLVGDTIGVATGYPAFYGGDPAGYSTDIPDLVSPDNPDGRCPEDLTGLSEWIFTSFQMTADPASNEISIFDISNLFYGMTIAPSSFRIEDKFITGSSGRVSIVLKDDRNGGLYRADAKTKHAKWANVGNLFYGEGVAIVKSPHIAHFGKDFFKTEFMGDQNVHVSSLDVIAPEGLMNSSSNPNYKLLSASLNANDTAPYFTYITSINLHDDNLNIIARANLAQPILKRFVEGYMFRIKMDY